MFWKKSDQAEKIKELELIISTLKAENARLRTYIEEVKQSLIYVRDVVEDFIEPKEEKVND